MLVIFDLDGVLIDTAELIKRAYRDVGVTPPDDILAQEYSDWLTGFGSVEYIARIRERKNRAYLNALILATPAYLPPFKAAMQLHKDEQFIGVLTGAPVGTLLTLALVDVRWNRFDVAYDGYKTPGKMYILGEYGKVMPNTRKVYVDDQPRPDNFPEDWTFIQYTMDGTHSLLAKIYESD